MTERLVRLHLGLARHRGAVGGGLALLTAGALWLASTLQFKEDFADMLPMANPAIAGQMDALQHLRQADRLFVDVHVPAPDPARLAAAADAMHAALREIPGLAAFRYRFSPDQLQDVFAQLPSRLPALLSADDLRALEPRLAVPALKARLEWLKKNLSQPQGWMFKELALADPVQLSGAVLARLQMLRAGVGDAQVVEGRITSADGRHVLLSAEPAFRASDLSPSGRLVAAVLSAARLVEGQFPAGTVRIAVTGAHRVALDNATLIRQDSTRASVLALLAIAGLMVGVFRRRWLAALGLLPTLFGALGAVAAFYFTGEAVSAVALGCGSILIGITVDYGIYVLYLADDTRPANREQLARLVARHVPPLTFGALTTMAAFVVMFLSPVAGHRQLAWFGLVGVALAAGFAALILPLLIPVKAGKAAHALPMTALVGSLFRWRERHNRLVVPVLLVFSALCVAGVLRLRFEGDLARFNGVTSATQHDDDVLKAVWGQALSLTTVVVSGPTREAALRKNEQVHAVLTALRERQILAGFNSVALLLPSTQTRREQWRSWQAFWSPSRLHEFSNSLVQAASELGYRAAAFQPFLQGLAARDEPPADEPGHVSAWDPLLEDYWTEVDGRFSVCTLVKAHDLTAFRELRTAVLAAVPDARLLNKTALADEIARIAKDALPVFGGWVALLNGLLLWLLLGRLSLVLITLVPMAAGVFWTLGLLGLLGLPIDMSNFIFVVFVIGVGGDYSLFLVMAALESWRGHPDRTGATGGAVSVCALTTLLGFGALVSARHPALFSVGLTALLGISLSLVATLLLVPMGMGWLRRRVERSTPALMTHRPSGVIERRRQVGRLYRYQGMYVEQYVFWKLRTDPLFRAVEPVVPPAGLIVDLGCGYGLVAHWLTLGQRERRVLGVDVDPNKLHAARATARFNPQVQFEFHDLLNWPDCPACDCVLLCDVLHYFPHAQKADILSRALAALRPGGWLVLRDAFAEASARHRWTAWSERWGVRLGQNQTAHGLHFESAGAQVALLAATGFREVHLKTESGLGSNQLVVARKP